MHAIGCAVIALGAVAAVAVMVAGFRTYGRRALDALRSLDIEGI